MENVIDRTTYRRECLKENSNVEKPKENKFTKLFLDQIILSMAIIIGVLAIKIIKLDDAFYFIKTKIEAGITYETLKINVNQYISKFKNMLELDESSSQLNLYIEDTALDLLNDESTDSSGEIVYETAVEGVNQLSDDATLVKNNFSVITPVKRNCVISFWMSM